MNVDLMTKTLDHIETLHAFEREGIHMVDNWDQGSWFTVRKTDDDVVCGTSACFAGWACVLYGDRLAEETVEHQYRCSDPKCVLDHTCTYQDAFAYDADGNRHEVRERAIELLGISYQRAEHLFDWENDLDTLRKRVRKAIRDAG